MNDSRISVRQENVMAELKRQLDALRAENGLLRAEAKAAWAVATEQQKEHERLRADAAKCEALTSLCQNADDVDTLLAGLELLVGFEVVLGRDKRA